jgi:hypothetical protein
MLDVNVRRMLCYGLIYLLSYGIIVWGQGVNALSTLIFFSLQKKKAIKHTARLKQF